MIVIFVGDSTDYLSLKASKFSQTATLITQDNYAQIESNKVYYISLGDFTDVSLFVDILNKADRIIYCPPNKWTDEKNNFSNMKEVTEYFLLFFKSFKIVNGLIDSAKEEKEIMLKLADKRKTNERQLWVAGCSLSHGVGVQSKEKYGYLLSQYYNLPVSFLTSPAASNQWAADQILRSNIKENDIVIWGITSTSRFPYYKNKESKLFHITPSFYRIYPWFNDIISVDRLTDKNLLYQTLTKIHEVINFCNSVKANLYLIGLLVSSKEMNFFHDLPNYYHLTRHFDIIGNSLIDIGTDNMHPGPEHHQWIANEIIGKIKIENNFL
jgi:hypothetical protein